MLPILLNHLEVDKLGTAKIRETETGISFRLQLDNSALADQLIEGISSRRISGVSPAFYVNSERWASDDYRVIEDAELTEISFVDMPAYAGTCASVVATRQKEAEKEKRPYVGISFEPETEYRWGI